MNFYSFFRALFFQLDPERSHNLALKALSVFHSAGGKLLSANRPNTLPVSAMGLNFPNLLGLAAGMDKNGDYIDALAVLGFGFIEIGTVTPRPQTGNPKPRLFRLPEAEAVINRMGFNNKGIDYLIAQVKKARYKGILGINIGKNFDTPIEHAVSDYLFGLKKAYPYADYVTINISSPNTEKLRQLQQQDNLRELLERLKSEQQSLNKAHGKYVPIVVKIAPDLDDFEISHIGKLLLDFEIDGVIATNTTVSRIGIEGLPHADESGGLSGKPLKDKATSVVSSLRSVVNTKIPIIASGGIMNGLDALEKIAAGATLIQVYSGLVYQGPGLVQEILDSLPSKVGCG